jgi:hypothetical protein
MYSHCFEISFRLDCGLQLSLLREPLRCYSLIQ